MSWLTQQPRAKLKRQREKRTEIRGELFTHSWIFQEFIQMKAQLGV